MEAYRITFCHYIEDLTGTGAATYGGRWNSKGIFILYASSTSSLALLETVVHMSVVPKENYCLAKLIIPENKILEIKPADLPDGWSSYPAPDILKAIGDKFILDHIFLALILPSAIMPEEKNILLNPNHIDFRKVSIEYKKEITIDTRLF